ncbi:hypothetical protein ACIRQF_31330 [Streptomyces sp. NPDC101191]|uniref:hypothetical protein n=1 Tax=Streptomyces sp. NPDC101191 TaxID=3366126 RepID=UPI003830BC60
MTTTSPDDASGPDVLCQNLTDALNALVDAGQFPDFHNLYGPYNDYRHQPYVIVGSRADAPWIVLDLTTRQFTMSSREQTLSGEHPRRPSGKHA